jgi:predicted secreted Zn-dependent protease
LKADLLRSWLAGLVVALPVAAQAEWQANEVVKTYAISGKTGFELYESIGKRGPEAKSGNRTIAHTNFKLTWSRDYRTEGSSCVLASARPKLTITYTLPKPSAKLAEPLRSNWERFITGIRDHEQVHGAFIKDLVKGIETATVGMTVADDPQCSKIRIELKRRLTELFEAYKQKNQDFEREEMSEGGNIHQLILALVNGG